MDARFGIRPLDSDTVGEIHRTLLSRTQLWFELSPPTHEQLSVLLGTAFWASLQKEEGKSTSFSLAYAPAKSTSEPFVLSSPESLSVESIVKLSPSINSTDRAIGVTSSKDDTLQIWGTCRRAFGIRNPYFGQWLKPDVLVLASIGPGEMALQDMTGNLVIFQSSHVQIIEGGTLQPLNDFLQAPLQALSSNYPLEFIKTAISVLLRAMLSHHHGGTLAIVPSTDQSWRKHITSIRYSCDPLFLSQVMRRVVKQSQLRLGELYGN